MRAFSVPSLNVLRIHHPAPRHIRLGPGLFLMRSGVPPCHFIPGVPLSLSPRQVVALGTSLLSSRINHRLITHRALTPLMVIEGQVQYLLVLARLVPTRKVANQYLLSALRLMGIPTPARLPPVKAGHLNLNLTHLAPRRAPSFPPHPVVILRGPTLGLKVPTRQVEPLPTRTRSPLPHMVSPILVPRLKVLH
jgi:hypothetical protein